MSEARDLRWQEHNRDVLVRHFDRLRRALRRAAGGERREDNGHERGEWKAEENSALATLVKLFELDSFERDVLLLCAGVELDSAIADRCAELSGASAPRGSVTFSLALAYLEHAHWGAVSASAPLRRYRLLSMQPGHGVASAGLHIEERVLDYLLGVDRMDSRLEPFLRERNTPEWMSEEHYVLATEVLGGMDGDAIPDAILHLWGDDPKGQEGVAALLAERASRKLLVLRHDDMPQPGAETEQFLELWTRESKLLPAFLMMQWEREAPSPQARHLAERVPGALLLGSREPLRLARSMESHEVNKPSAPEQVRLWRETLGPVAGALSKKILETAEQFRLSADTIAAISQSALQAADGEQGVNPERIASRLWGLCRVHARPRLEGLAERIIPGAGWDDLVLPDAQKEMLRQLCSQARNRLTVNETWGFATRGRRGLGLSALFSGPSGTGKTMAAEVLAAELRLDLFRIDLAAVVSKYIGETEKNLQRVFDAAENGGAILLFDEADALFGKRTDVKDSHDRYANIEVGYLLQRMESFGGIAILTTNLKNTMDKAFQRRLRFSIEFPFPDQPQREAIWTKVFPAQTPTRGLEPRRLASLNMSGGNIRNIALNAAFLAADAGEPVNMGHVLAAAKQEALKVERPLAEMEVRGWV